MRQLDLKEYEQSEPQRLSAAERDALADAELGISVAPAPGADGRYHLTPGSTVGAVEIGDLSALIRPKIGIPKLLSMACYAMGIYRQQQERFDFSEAVSLPDTLALALSAAALRAFARGLLYGYRAEEDALYTVRGRIRVDEQIRRRFGVPMPIEVAWDEFTDDIPANRLIKAAVRRLSGMRLRSMEARRNLAHVAGMVGNVSPVEFPAANVPEVKFDRLNERYRDVIGLARLILRHGSFESGRGGVRASGFLMDMNRVFEEFVTVALRDALGLSDNVLRAQQSVTLDKGGRVRMRPDLSWWEGDRCVFVGDAKYKRIPNQVAPNADLYQLLAYTTALDLGSGLLIYAKGEGEAATHTVRYAGKRLQVAALDLDGELEDVLRRVGEIGGMAKEQRNRARAAVGGGVSAPVKGEGICGACEGAAYP